MLDAPAFPAAPCDLAIAGANPWKPKETTDSAGLSAKPADGVPTATIIATNSQLQERLDATNSQWHWLMTGV
jgi:hypothetical protein